VAFRLRQTSGRDENLDMMVADYDAGHVGLTKATKFVLGMN
jgi:hypothetical protein